MENRKVPALIAIAGIVIALIVFFFVIDDDTADQETETTVSQETKQPDGPGDGKSDKPDKPDKPEVPEIEIRDGAPVGGALELEVTEGEDFSILVTTDTADELHLHGYELYFDIVPGKPNEIDVPAKLGTDVGTGVFELESHTTAVVLAEISVVPD